MCERKIRKGNVTKMVPFRIRSLSHVTTATVPHQDTSTPRSSRALIYDTSCHLFTPKAHTRETCRNYTSAAILQPPVSTISAVRHDSFDRQSRACQSPFQMRVLYWGYLHP